MNSSDSTVHETAMLLRDADSAPVLAREAGVPFQAPWSKNSDIDTLMECLNLMEVVHMLCPAWPVRDRPMQGINWKL